MLELKSTIAVESKLHPGVTFTVRVLNNIQRVERDMATLATRADFDDQQRIAHGASEAIEDDKRRATPERRAFPGREREYAEASERANAAFVRTMHAIIGFQLAGVDGVAIDGNVATPESLQQFAPDDLVAELYIACQRASGMLGDEEKNSQSPGTSSEAAQPGEIPTTA